MNAQNQKLNQELTEALQKLLVKNYDAEKGFIKAMQEIEHTALIFNIVCLLRYPLILKA